MADRQSQRRAFLHRAGWGEAESAYLAGDASDRSYDRLTRPGRSAVLMDNPPGGADDPGAFSRIARHLSGLGLSAPRILAEDLDLGLLLLEDLGDDLFARLVAADPFCETRLYAAAAGVLARIHANPPPPDLADLSAASWAEAACFAFDWYRFAATDDRIDTSAFRDTLTDLIQRMADGPRVMILRDFHAENLIWLPERNGLARVGLLDFQLAQLGQPGYDLVSLLQDARRDVSAEAADQTLRLFLDATGHDAAGFRRSYAVLGAQRALRILGVFARLCLVSGKAGYLPLLPRVWGQLQENLAQPGMAALAGLCNRLLPPPEPGVLSAIGAKCGHFR